MSRRLAGIWSLIAALLLMFASEPVLAGRGRSGGYRPPPRQPSRPQRMPTQPRPPRPAPKPASPKPAPKPLVAPKPTPGKQTPGPSPAGKQAAPQAASPKANDKAQSSATQATGKGHGGDAGQALKLNKSLASKAQMKEPGTIIAGAGKAPFRDAPRIAKTYGGKPEDWVKKSSSSYTDKDGSKQETHWVENQKTGKRVEFKTILNGKQ